MPLLLFIFLVTLGIGLALVVYTKGWKRLLAWGTLALLALPVAIIFFGGMILTEMGLEWRANVEICCGLSFTAGVLALLVWAGAFLWRQADGWQVVLRALGRCVILAAIGFLCLFTAWIGLLFTAFWAEGDTVVERDGQTVVRESYGMADGYNYYAYHGPLVRGAEMLAGSGELRMQERIQEIHAAKEEVAETLGLDVSSGIVYVTTDTHGGFHGNGTTYTMMRFSYTNVMPDQLKDHQDWTALPDLENDALFTLAALPTNEQGDRLIPELSEIGEGWYWFLDRHSEAEDPKDCRAAVDRYSYNFTLAIYDTSERTLHFCRVDT